MNQSINPSYADEFSRHWSPVLSRAGIGVSALDPLMIPFERNNKSQDIQELKP